MRDDTRKLIREIMNEAKWNPNMPERRKNIQIEHCAMHDKIGVMYQAIYGPDNRPEEGLLHITKQNAKYISTLNSAISKLTWLIVLAGLSAMGSFLIQVGKMMAQQ